MTLIFEQQTRILRRCFFDVHNEVGVGFAERGSHEACRLWLEKNRIPTDVKPPQPLTVAGEVVHVLYPELVVWDSISLELKSVDRRLRSTEFVQLFDYLKCRGDRLGLLVNFGLNRVQVERIVYERPVTRLEEDWSAWQSRIRGNDREVGRALADALRSIYELHGTGYGTEVTDTLLVAGLRRRGLFVEMTPFATPSFHGIKLEESKLNCVIVQRKFVLTWTALFDSVDPSRSRGFSYLKCLNLPWGIAANFGKTTATLVALNHATSTTPNHPPLPPSV